MNDNKFKGWGTLDTCDHSLNAAATDFANLYINAEYRMRPEDTKRMRKYLNTLSRSIANMKSTLRCFEEINK